MPIIWSNITSPEQLLSAPNVATGNFFWLAILITLFIILLMTFMNFGFEIALMTSGFATMVLGIFLAYMDLVAWKYVMIFIALLVIGILYIMWSSTRENM